MQQGKATGALKGTFLRSRNGFQWPFAPKDGSVRED